LELIFNRVNPLAILVSGVFLEILQDLPGLRSGQVGSDAHVDHDGFPLARRELGGKPFLMAAAAVDGI